MSSRLRLARVPIYDRSDFRTIDKTNNVDVIDDHYIRVERIEWRLHVQLLPIFASFWPDSETHLIIWSGLVEPVQVSVDLSYYQILQLANLITFYHVIMYLDTYNNNNFFLNDNV